MMVPRICMRGVGRTRAPSLYQLTAMPGRLLMSQRSFRTLPGSNRRCSVVSSLRSSRTSVETLVQKVSACCGGGYFLLSLFFLFLEVLSLAFFQSAILHLPFKPRSHPVNYDLQLFNPFISYPPHKHTHTHTMKSPWRPGGLTLLLFHPPHPPLLLTLQTDSLHLLTPERRRKETWRKSD